MRQFRRAFQRGRGLAPPAAAIVVALTGAACSGSQAAQPGPGGPQAVPVEAVEVRPTRIEDASEHVALLRARRSVEVLPQVEGYITRILVRSGDLVARGQVLMRIDQRRQKAAVLNQEAQRAARQANAVYWRGEYQRASNLFASGAITRRELDQTAASVRSAEADLAAQGAQVAAEAVQLRYFDVVAPWDGVVGDIPVRLGDLATPQTHLTSVDDNAAVEVLVEVPMGRSSEARLGLPLAVFDDGGAPVAQVETTFVAPRASTGTQTLLLKGLLDNRDRLLRSGQVVRARLVWSTREGPAVPVTAAQSQNGQMFVWVLTRDRRGGWTASPRPVQVGPIQDQLYPIQRGLEVGERVVVSGVQKLRPGAPVVPKAPAPPGQEKE